MEIVTIKQKHKVGISRILLISISEHVIYRILLVKIIDKLHPSTTGKSCIKNKKEERKKDTKLPYDFLLRVSRLHKPGGNLYIQRLCELSIFNSCLPLCLIHALGSGVWGVEVVGTVGS